MTDDCLVCTSHFFEAEAASCKIDAVEFRVAKVL